MITIDQAKLHCRIDDNAEDSLIGDWILEAEEVIQNDLDRKIIMSESDRTSDLDIIDSKWLDSLRLIYVQYRYSRSTDDKPKAYWALLQKFRVMGV